MTYSIRSAISMAFLSTLLLAGCSSDSGDFRTAENSKFAPGKLEVPEPSGMLPEGLEAIVVPDGSPTELTAFINQVSKQVPETPEQARNWPSTMTRCWLDRASNCCSASPSTPS